MRKTAGFVALIVCLMITASTAHSARAWDGGRPSMVPAESPPEMTALSPPASMGVAGFQSVAAERDLVVAGAVGWSGAGTRILGAAVVFERSGDSWAATKLSASDVDLSWGFGASVAVDGGRVIVGAPKATSDPGAVYVFENVDGSWVETKLVAPEAAAWDRFGTSVAADGGRIVVGAPALSFSGPNDRPGAAYLFEREADGEWVASATLSATDPAPGDGFGRSVAIDGDRIVVGAPRCPTALTCPTNAAVSPGAVHVFEPDNTGGWDETAVLTGSVKGRSDHFGTSVAIHDEVIAVGAPIESEEQGAAYVFTRVDSENLDDWTVQDRLAPVNGRRSFGVAVAAGINQLLVGAPRDVSGGAAHIYTRASNTTWTEQRVAQVATYFGSSVALTEDYAAVAGWDNTVLLIENRGRFLDDDDSTFESDIEWLAAEGITRGCNPPTNTLFCPDDLVTRGQMAAFLARALKLPQPSITASPFIDIAGTFALDIERVYEAGITKGCNPPANDRYCPDDYVTRGQMAAFLVRALGYTDGSGGNLFTDDDGHTFEPEIDKLGTAAVTRGCNPPANDRYCPDDPVTRGQMAAFLHRALGG